MAYSVSMETLKLIGSWENLRMAVQFFYNNDENPFSKIVKTPFWIPLSCMNEGRFNISRRGRTLVLDMNVSMYHEEDFYVWIYYTHEVKCGVPEIGIETKGKVWHLSTGKKRTISIKIKPSEIFSNWNKNDWEEVAMAYFYDF